MASYVARISDSAEPESSPQTAGITLGIQLSTGFCSLGRRHRNQFKSTPWNQEPPNTDRLLGIHDPPAGASCVPSVDWCRSVDVDCVLDCMCRSIGRCRLSVEVTREICPDLTQGLSCPAGRARETSCPSFPSPCREGLYLAQGEAIGPLGVLWARRARRRPLGQAGQGGDGGRG